MNYLHEAIIKAIDFFMDQGMSFSAYDVTEYVRDMDLHPEDIDDADIFTSRDGIITVMVEHKRVKSLVHLYMKNYNPNQIQKSDNGQYIIYTPTINKSPLGSVVDTSNQTTTIAPLTTQPLLPGISSDDKKLVEAAFAILKQKGII